MTDGVQGFEGVNVEDRVGTDKSGGWLDISESDCHQEKQEETDLQTQKIRSGDPGEKERKNYGREADDDEEQVWFLVVR